LRDVPVVEVTWDRVDALPFPFVLSAVGPPPECAPVEDITVVHGNVVLADHGETVRAPGPVLLREGRRTIPAVPFPAPHEVVPAGAVELCCTGEGAPAAGPSRDPAYEPVLERRPLVFAEPLTAGIPATDSLRQDPRRAVPALAVFGPVTGRDPGDVVREADAGMVRPAPVRYRRWSPRRDLLSSAPDDRHVVAEIDDDGVAHLRFGSEPGGRPVPGTRMLVWYRTGGGHAGNVGGGALRHVVTREVPREGRIVGVSNPLPASGGTDPEPVDEVRLRAPHAFRSRIRRAVAAEDYAAVAQRDFPDEVQRAAATVAVERVGTDTDERDRTVVTVRVDPVGASGDEPGLRERVWRHLEKYRRIGHMVKVAGPDYVAVDLAVTVRLLAGHQPGAVRGALRDRLGNRALPDGSRGFFHPDALTFGQGIPLSAVLGAVHGVPGVASARVTRLTPHAGGPDLPADDVLSVRPDQIVRMDDDPDRPENGSLIIGLEAGT
jgi:hypothetical protein